MTLFGVDIHPQFQQGISIEQIAAEGFSFMAVKVSEGTNNQWEAGAADWFRRGKAVGLSCLAYHYLRPDDIPGQARVFAGALARCGVPGMLDAEYPLSNGDTLTVPGIRSFLTAVRSFGAQVPLVYLPHWYWQRMGSPDLSWIPGLWASSYVTGTGFAANLFESITPRYWSPYGNRPVSVLQFTDRGLVAGRNIDVDVFPGTRDELAALLGAAPGLLSAHRTKGPRMITLPGTTPPGDVDSPPATWPQRNHLVLWNVAGGWEGGAAFSVAVQDWLGRKADNARGYLLLASWVMPGGVLTPVDPAYTTAGGGRVINAQTPTQEWAAPRGCIGVTLNYSAPAPTGGGVAVGRSG